MITSRSVPSDVRREPVDFWGGLEDLFQQIKDHGSYAELERK